MNVIGVEADEVANNRLREVQKLTIKYLESNWKLLHVTREQDAAPFSAIPSY
jgi:hypothetical protein